MRERQLSRRGVLATLAGSVPAIGSATSGAIDRSWRIVIDPAPYASLAEVGQSSFPLAGGADAAVRQSVHTAFQAARELRRYLCKLNGIDPGNDRAYTITAAGGGGDENRALILLDASVPAQRRRIEGIPAAKAVLPRLDAKESFALAPGGAFCYLIGHDRTGVLYGAYHFLELQGVRWYAPGESNEVVPGPKAAVLPRTAVIERPRYFTRGFFTRDRQGGREFIQWMARNRLNYWTVDEPDHEFMKTSGLRLNAGGHIIYEKFLNPARYFEAHPEWYGLYQGKRIAFKNNFGVNICTSNPGVMAELCGNIVSALAGGEWRDVDILEFWALDAAKWCECSNCKALGTPTDRMLLMVHQMRQTLDSATRSGKLDRKVPIFFAIYSETLPAPTRPLPAGFDYDNCIGTVFPIHRCFAHTLDDPKCSETNAAIWKTILGWQSGERFYRGQYVIGEYYNVSTFKSLPALFTRVMRHDVPLYYSNGARHFHYMHVPTSLLGPKRFTNYLLARLLWNPQTDVAEIRREYFAAFYGTAAGQMTEFYTRLEYAMSAVGQWKSGRLRLTARLAADLEPLFPQQHLQLSESHPAENDGVDLEESVAGLRRCRAILDQAVSEASGVLRERLLEDDRNLRYAENTVNLYYLMAQALLARRRGDLEKAREFYKASAVHARGLKQEVELVQNAFHANARDGLDASLVEEGWKKLGASLGLPGLLESGGCTGR